METIINAIKYPFSDKEWQKKLLYIVLVFVSLNFIGGLLNIFIQIPLSFLAEYMRDNTSAYSMFSFLSSIISLGGYLLTFPITIFLSGYLFEYMKNIAESKNEILPSLSDIGGKFVKGLKLIILEFIVSIPSTILALMTISASFVFIAMLVSANSSILLRFLVVFIAFILLVLICILNFFISAAAKYIYVKTDRLSKAINPKTIVITIKNNEKPLLNIFGYLLLTGFLILGISLSSVFLICISFITTPIITLSGSFVRSYILGNEYKKFSILEN